VATIERACGQPCKKISQEIHCPHEKSKAKWEHTLRRTPFANAEKSAKKVGKLAHQTAQEAMSGALCMARI
jgi:hypothetical protein